MHTGFPLVVWWADDDCPFSLFISKSFLREARYSVVLHYTSSHRRYVNIIVDKKLNKWRSRIELRAYFPYFHSWISAFMSFFPTVKLLLCLSRLHQHKHCMWCNNGNLTVVQTIAEQRRKSCIQVTTLNLIHFKVVEAMGLKIITSRSPWMASSDYQLSRKYTYWF
jgi:hypothetical protein